MFAAVALTRIAPPILNLSLLLAAAAAHGYAIGGLVLTGFSVALAVCVPVSGRLVDRFRPRAVLLALLVVHVLACAATVLALAAQAGPALLIAAAIGVGGSAPPAAPVIRASWPAILPAEQLRTAYALDAVLNETMVVGGLLVVSGLLALAAPVAAVGVAGACTALGVLIALPGLRAPAERVRTRGVRGFLGPLAQGRVRVLLGMAAADMVAFGCLLVGVSALATSAAAPEASGVLLSVFSAGAVFSALCYGMRERDTAARPRLVALHAVSALLLAIVAATSGPVLAGVVLLLLGLVSGMRDTLHQLVLGSAAAAEHRTEAFAWLTTCMWGGNGIGTAVAGQLVGWSGGSHRAALLTAALAAGAASVLALMLRARAGAPQVQRQS